jgi:hypothetical protein
MPCTIDQYVNIVRNLLGHLLHGLKACTTDAEHEEMEGKIVYALAKLCRLMLENICKLSHSQHQKLTARQEANRGCERAKRNQLPRPDRQTGKQDVSTQLARLLVWFLSSLDLTSSVQHKILQAALYHVLTRAGTVLAALVFGEERSHNDWTTMSPTEIANGTVEKLSMLDEAPHLAWILERVFQKPLEVSRKHKSLELSATNFHAQKTLSTDGLVIMSYKTLQSTLLRAVFEDDTVTFEERLKPIPDQEIAADAPPCKDDISNIADWYKAKVWEAVGWNMLRDHI